MSTDEIPNETHEVDVEIVENSEPKRPRWMLPVLGLAVAGAVVAGAVISATGDSDGDQVAVESEADALSSTTTAPPQDDSSAQDHSVDDGEVAVVTTVGPAEDAGFDADAAEFASEAMYDMGDGPNGVIFDGEKFVSLGYGPAGSTLRTSSDGLEWDERPLDGVPAESNVIGLAEHEGTYAVLFEQWNPESEAEGRFFEPSEGPTFHLGISTDLEQWDVNELAVAVNEGYRNSATGLALGEAGVVILAQSYAEGPDEMRILFEAGLINETDLDQYCGLEFGESEITVHLCDYSDFDEELMEVEYEEFEARYAEAETDEEREALELEFEQRSQPERVIAATITPDDPVYAELDGIYDYQYEEAPSTVVLAGEPGTQLGLASLPVAGYVDGVVAIDGGFAVAVQDVTGETSSNTVLTSTNGLVWEQAGTLPFNSHGRLHALNDALVIVGSDEQGQPRIHRSNDAGSTWQQVDLPIDLYGAYPIAVSGPAGLVVFVTGSTEPYPEYGPEEPLLVTKDGFTLTIEINEAGGLTLTDPDGAVVHSLTMEQLEGAGDEDLPGVFRINPISDTPTFLDPETGEDLVAFTNEDFDRAYEESYGDIEELYEEPALTTLVYYSPDETNWSPVVDERLDFQASSGSLNPIAVGDDELILSQHTWHEPPADLYAFEREDREPTAEEIEALDAWSASNSGGDSVEYFRIELG